MREEINEVKLLDKYADKSIKFYDMQDRYDLIFSSDFEMADQVASIYSDLLIDLKEADKNKELHIWINSQGGSCSTLILLMQQIQEFEYVVTIGTGEIDSCGFMLWCLGDERYLGQLTFCMYHGISSGNFAKANEMQEFGIFIEKYQSLFEHVVREKGILTDEELEKGRYTEKWYLGKELIERGVSLDFVNYKNRIKFEKIEALRLGEQFFIRDVQGYYYECDLISDGKKKRDLFSEFLKASQENKYEQLEEEVGEEFLCFFENWLKLKSRILNGDGFFTNTDLLESYSGMYEPIEIDELKKKIKIWAKTFNIDFKANVKKDGKEGFKLKSKKTETE